MSEYMTMSASRIKSRRLRPKIERTNDEFKQHERVLMNKRNQEVNNAVTKKCHQIWNQYLPHKPKPNPLQFTYIYHNIDKYLSVCDNYEASQHKDPKQKWWNNQKASEMSQAFLPSILNATDQMAEYLGRQISAQLQSEFTNYCIFELLETAISSVFSTMRSGSNEVFLRTSFQYSKANLRKKLISYFVAPELAKYDLKMRKKKDLWSKLIKEKKEKLLMQFMDKNDRLYGHLQINNLPPSVQQIQSDNMSCSTSSNPNTCGAVVPPINWNESHPKQYEAFQTIPLATPYHHSHGAQAYMARHAQSAQIGKEGMKVNGYGSHRQCVDCVSYMNKMSELLNVNNKLQQETNHLKQLNREYVADRQNYRSKYQNLLLQLQQNNSNNYNNSNNWTFAENNNNIAWI